MAQPPSIPSSYDAIQAPPTGRESELPSLGQAGQPEYKSDGSGSAVNDRNLAEIVELVKLILERADKPTLAACARVCRMWSELALDSLWSALDSVAPILQLLAPLIRSPSGNLSVADILHFSTLEFYNANWERFGTYTNRVRSLSCTDLTTLDGGKTRFRIRHSDIQHAALLYPHGSSLAPKLETLAWTVTSDEDFLSPLLFLPPTLKTLSLKLQCSSNLQGSRRILQSLRFRLHALQQFSLRTQIPAELLDSDLSECLRTAPALQLVYVPMYYHTATLVRAIKDLPWLRVFGKADGLNPPSTRAGMRLLPSADGFSRLQVLYWNVDTLHAAWPDDPGAFKRLTGLTLRDPAFTSIEAIQRHIAALSRCCPLLKRLNLDLISQKDHVAPVLTWGYLDGLTGCRGLDHLHLLTDNPIHLQSADIKAMSTAWPSLRFLEISTSPPKRLPKSQVNDISILRDFATYMPYLTSLGLFVTIPASLDFNGDMEPTGQFKALKTLGFGSSELPSEAVPLAGFYLASLCRNGVTVAHDTSYSGRYSWTLFMGKQSWVQLKQIFDIASRSKEIQYQRRKEIYLSSQN